MDAPGVVDRRVLVAPARFEQEHGRSALDQAARNDRAGRAGADDDDVRAALTHDSDTQTLFTSV